MKKTTRLGLSCLLAGLSGGAHALSFDLTFTAGTSAQEQASFIAAGQMWSDLFTDNVTVKLTVGTSTSLGVNILGQASSRDLAYSYADVRDALHADASSALDQTAVSHLNSADSFGMLLNRTSNSPHGAGSATPFVDDDGDVNNSVIRMTAGNARALGLSVSSGTLSGCLTACDAFISFNANFTWDFDRSNGIDTNAYDFVGIAAHEIGHALGFTSGVDVLDFNSGTTFFSDRAFNDVSTLDLFRWSDLSTASGVIDWTADTRVKYFSVDGGVTKGATFSTGVNHGDGRQASHWKDNLSLGILDPTAARGELLSISGNDLAALDAIGWNLPTTLVPEPNTYVLVFAGLAVLTARGRKK